MSDVNTIATAIAQEKNTTWNNALAACGTLTAQELADRSDVWSTDEVAAALTSAFEEADSEIKGMAKAQLDNDSQLAGANSTSTTAREKFGSFDPQDAKAVKQVMPPTLNSKSATPPTVQMPAYNPNENYPDTVAFPMKDGSWLRYNNATHLFEAVHYSGSSIQMDAEGNVIIHITGAVGMLVGKDSVTNVVGAYNLIANNVWISSLTSAVYDAATTLKIKAGQLVNQLAALIKLN